MPEAKYTIATRQETEELFGSSVPLGAGSSYVFPVREVAGYAAVAMLAASDQPFTITVEEACAPAGPFSVTRTLASAVDPGSGLQAICTRVAPCGAFMLVTLRNAGAPQAVLSFCALGYPESGAVAGDAGAQGVQGIQGPAGGGPQGFQGLQGDPGPQGVQGPFGTGPQGNQGAAGPQGIAGVGVQGPQGDVGDAGPQGATGTGSQGFQGDIGTQGNQGDLGPQGAAGVGSQGPQGLQGTAGVGTQGFQGDVGAVGPQGNQGATGAGTQGPQGFQGDIGTGTQGVQGPQGSGTGGASAEFVFFYSGTLQTNDDAKIPVQTKRANTDVDILEIELQVAPTGQSAIFEFFDGVTSLGTVTVAVSTVSGNTPIPLHTVPALNRVTMKINQVGVGVAGVTATGYVRKS